MKRTLAATLTVLLMGLLLWSGLHRPVGSTHKNLAKIDSEAPATVDPAEARIAALMESARLGDVAAYLDAFSGPLRERLAREASERGGAFADDLRKASLARKSHAVFTPEPDGPDAARVTVESVYPDRNERQTYRVEREASGGWRVTGVETVRSHQPKAKFGSPAAFVAPEGVPVQGAGVTVETGDDVVEPQGP
jgi:hypothetical protein